MTDQSRLRIEITTGHCLGGAGNDIAPGEILEAPKDLTVDAALRKVRLDYARIVPLLPETGPESAAGSGPAPATISHADPTVEIRDPQVNAPDPALMKGRSRTGGR